MMVVMEILREYVGSPPSAPSCLSERIARRVSLEESWSEHHLVARCGPVQDSDGLPEWESMGAMPEMGILVGEEVGDSLKEDEPYYARITHL